MILRMAILEVRIALGEIRPRIWTDGMIINWLNEGAQLMCSLGQPLTNVIQIPTQNGVQEYVLPRDVDEIKSVRYYQGTLLKQRPVDAEDIQVGGFVTGTPTRFYTRVASLVLAPQVAGGNIQVSQINPPTAARKPMKVIGLYPVPTTAQLLTVTYFARHYWMQNDMDEMAIAEEFQRGPIAFAISKGKSKIMAYTESDKYMQEFKEYSNRYQEKMQNQGQEGSFPRLRVRSTGEWQEHGGSSWIYVGDAGPDT